MNGDLLMFKKKNVLNNLDYNTLPKHVAIIMDGNRTWAKKRGLPTNLGHRKGAKTLKDITVYASDLGIKYLTVFAFSTENWSRSKEEVNYLMKLPTEFIDEYEDLLLEKQIKLTWIGNEEYVSEDNIQKIRAFEGKSRNCQGLNFIIAFNYGGRDEIIRAVNKIIEESRTTSLVIDENNFDAFLQTKAIPDVDLLIRTSGQLRISNFLIWKLAYSELYFTDVLWPNFDKKDFDKALLEYNKRERRYGGTAR